MVGSSPPHSGEIHPHELIRFSEHVESEIPADRRAHLAALAEQLGPWTQGPFLLGGDLVVGSGSRSHLRWEELRKHPPEGLSGKRVLVVGSNAGYDAFMSRLLGAEFVLACEPSESHRQAVFLESIYKAGIEFRQIGWQDLRPEQFGRFNVIHCHGAVHRELHPILMLGRLRQLLAPQGTALFGAALHSDSEASEYVRFIQETYDGDPTWWWLPGSNAMRRMLRAAGFDVNEEFDIDEGMPSKPGTTYSYFRTTGRMDANGDFPVAAQTGPVAGDAERVVAKSMWPLGHFYSPAPDLRKLASEPTRSRVWPDTPHKTRGIDWRDDAQLELCRRVFAQQMPLRFSWEATDDPHEYFGANSQLAPLDAAILQAMLRHLRPARMIEIGSGYSSLVTARVNRECLEGQMQFTCIEPYPRDFLLDGVPGISDLRVEEVQETPLELFDELGDGDVLFVDTSHTVKTGGEVPWIFGQIIPRLNPGVVIHVHDIFLPGEYPKQWVLNEGRNWNENYLVEAFLSFNAEFELVFGAQWMLQNHRDALLDAFSGLLDRRTINGVVRPSAGKFQLGPDSGSSIWVQRRGEEQGKRDRRPDRAATEKTAPVVPTVDIAEIAERAKAFEKEFTDAKSQLAPNDFWYPYGSIGNFRIFDELLTGEHRQLSRLTDGKPIADIGGADGDCAFFLESLGYRVQLVDNPATNFNRLRGAGMLKEALSSSVEIVPIDLDAQFSLPEREYGLVLFLGLLYHLKNPYYVLETLSHRARYCLLSTRVGRFTPDSVDLSDVPVGYLVDELEMNDDPTNYWVFSHAGLRRLLSRTGWETCSELYIGNTAESQMVDLEKDERAFLLIRSKHAD